MLIFVFNKHIISIKILEKCMIVKENTGMLRKVVENRLGVSIASVAGDARLREREGAGGAGASQGDEGPSAAVASEVHRYGQMTTGRSVETLELLTGEPMPCHPMPLINRNANTNNNNNNKYQEFVVLCAYSCSSDRRGNIFIVVIHLCSIHVIIFIVVIHVCSIHVIIFIVVIHSCSSKP